MNEQSFFPLVNKPGRYLGREYNIAARRADDRSLLCALVFPDLYEIGMSHQGLQILYHLLNAETDIVAERCYCPDLDAENLLKARGMPLTSLESGRPLASFDLIGLTLPHELCYTNILTILDRAHIPFYAAERPEGTPLIIGGGACSLNPEPVAAFFDAVLLGDGEEAIIDIARTVQQGKDDGASREEMLDRLGTIDGIYLPHRYRPDYDREGRTTAVRAAAGAPARVARRVLADLDRIDHLKHPLVPNARIVHDRLGIEIARGCTRGCRFCQAGITYRPVRERSIDQIMELAECGIANSGFEELALQSLSTGDYSCLSEVLPRLMNRFADDNVSVALPSMRVGTLTPELMDEIRRVRKTGFTLAPEAGSERLRRAINKGISEEDLLATARDAFALGWSLIKLYFMVGLPDETIEDIDAITELARKTAAAGAVSGRGRKRVTVSVGTFVPKPHTPFQWEEQLSIDDSRERIARLKSTLPRGFNLKWHAPEQSFLEGVFARGDRRLSPLIIRAWEDGARLDSWSDHFNLARWQEAAGKCGIDLDFYLRRRDENEILPWHHLDSRVDEAFLRQERSNARQQIYTPDCRYHGCRQCGLCDFKTIRPVVRNEQRLAPPAAGRRGGSDRRKSGQDEAHFKYLVSYARTGTTCYLGHLEILQVIFRALRRAGIRTNFSLGFNPAPKVSFGPALPVGTESFCEYFLIDLPEPLKDPAVQARELDRVLPEGLSVTGITLHPGRLPQDIVSSYRVTTPFTLEPLDRDRLQLFSEATEWFIARERKGRTSQLDIRPMVQLVAVEGADRIRLDLVGRSGSPGVKPIEALEQILGRSADELITSRVLKTSWTPLQR